MLLLSLIGCFNAVVIPDDSGLLHRTPTSGLTLNEIQSDNESTFQADPGQYPDWFELYNLGPDEVDLASVQVRSGGQTWTGPEGSLGVGEFWLVAADDGATPDGAPFKISNDGDALAVFIGEEFIDQVDISELDDDRSWARFPDGGEPAVTTRPTPGFTNGSRAIDTDPTDELFTPDHVTDVELTLSDAAIAALRASPTTDVEASFACEGVYFPSVAVHIKGRWGSARSIDQKAAWKIDLNAIEDRSFRGLEALTLNNMVQDPSYVHEWMTYSLFREMGVPAPRVGYARVFVNGQLFGLYANIETPDDAWLDRWYGNHDGLMWEGAYGVDISSDGIPGFEFDEGDVDDRTALYTVSGIMDQGASEDTLLQMESVFDMDEFAANMAVEAVVLHWDGYTTRNNYRVYTDPQSGQFGMFPWGTDQTFHDVWYGPYDGGGRLFQYCLQIPSCRDRYDRAMLDAIRTLDGLDLWPQVEQIEAMLRPDIEADPRREFGIETHDQWMSDTEAILTSWPDQLRSTVQAQ